MTSIEVTSTESAAVARWAARHARSVRVGRGAAGPAAAGMATATVSSASVIQTWDTGQQLVNSIAWTRLPDGRPVLVTAGDGVLIWDTVTGRLTHNLTRGLARRVGAQQSGTIVTAAWAGSGARPLLALGAEGGGGWVWDPATDTYLGELPAPEPPTPWGRRRFPLAWGTDSDGQPFLLAGDATGAIRMFEPESPVPLAEFPAYSLDSEERWPVPLLCAWGRAGDGTARLASGAWNDVVRVQDPDSGHNLFVGTAANRQEPRYPTTAGLTSMTYGLRADGRLLLATAGGHRADVWTETETETDADGRLTGHVLDIVDVYGTVESLSWVSLADGRMLLAGSVSDAVHLWDGWTFERLHTTGLFPGQQDGFAALEWTTTPDKRLLLATASRDGLVALWDVVLDPPVTPPAPPPSRRPARDRPVPRPPSVLDPPEEVTPEFGTRTGEGFRVACAALDDGHVLLANATMAQTRPYISHATTTDGRHISSGPEFTYWLVWDASTGTLLHRLRGQSVGLSSLAFGRLTDGRLALATADIDRFVRIWDPVAGELLGEYRGGHDRGVSTVAWVRGPDGTELVATGGDFDGAVRLWDPLTGEPVRVLTGHGNHVNVIIEGELASGQRCLVTGGSNAQARLWDPDTGELLRTLEVTAADRAQRADEVWSGVWGHGPDGRPQLAIGAADGAVRIWDPDTGELLRTLTGHQGPVYTLAWAGRLGWPDILVSASGGSYDGTARIWDAPTGTELARLPSKESGPRALDLARSPDGDLLLLIATERWSQHQGPVRIWRIAAADTAVSTRPGRGAGQETAAGEPGGTAMPGYPAAELADWLLRLGNGGLWPPLGVVADLVTLTGQLADAYWSPLANDPGIVRLRGLGWAKAARLSFAALAAGALAIPDIYFPPPEAEPGPLAAALVRALTGRAGAAGTAAAPTVPVAELRAATAAITDKTLALLAILGPEACAADPLLPARLARHAAALPALSRRQLRLLADAGSWRATVDRHIAQGTAVYSPGTAGLARSGPLSRLLTTQLALPGDLMAMRLAESQLLYRQHRAPAPPSPDAVTIILDTTPPTCGPAGIALRLAAHLLTLTLWAHESHPALVTLDTPDKVTELRAPADLITLWTAVTLSPPLPALPTALTSAGATGRPVLLATHHHTARAADYAPGPATRLLTTHQPPEQPPRSPGGPWHAHLPPAPDMAELGAAVARLIMPDTGAGAAPARWPARH